MEKITRNIVNKEFVEKNITYWFNDAVKGYFEWQDVLIDRVPQNCRMHAIRVGYIKGYFYASFLGET